MNQTKVSLKHSTTSGCLLSAAAWILFVASPASAGTVNTYSDTASFLGALQSSYLENFNSNDAGPHGGAVNYSGSGGYSYSVDAPGDSVYIIDPASAGDRALSTTTADFSLIFTFDAGIQGVGGSFFLTDDPGNLAGGVLTITLNDGTTQTLTNPAIHGFNGFVSTGADISSLTLATSATVFDAFTGQQTCCYVTADNVYVGGTGAGAGGGGGGGGNGNPGPGNAPEPASMALMFSGLVAAGFRAYRKRTA
jgi:hypothetical protein